MSKEKQIIEEGTVETTESKPEQSKPEEKKEEQKPEVITLVGLLTDDERRVLFGRFNRQFDKAHGEQVRSLVREFGFDYNTAAMLYSMRLDAQTLLSNARMSDAVDSIMRHARSFFGSESSQKEALRIAHNVFDNLNPFEAKAVGKNVRIKLFKEYNRTDANRALDMLIAEMAVQESEWC